MALVAFANVSGASGSEIEKNKEDGSEWWLLTGQFGRIWHLEPMQVVLSEPEMSVGQNRQRTRKVHAVPVPKFKSTEKVCQEHRVRRQRVRLRL